MVNRDNYKRYNGASPRKRTPADVNIPIGSKIIMKIIVYTDNKDADSK